MTRGIDPTLYWEATDKQHRHLLECREALRRIYVELGHADKLLGTRPSSTYDVQSMVQTARAIASVTLAR